MSTFSLLLISLLFIIKSCICQNDIEAEYFDDFGAWLLFRKIVDGVNGNFGIGYSFTVKYEITNIGTQSANNIKIQDEWDWNYVERYNDKSNSEKITFESSEKLAPKSTLSFSYQLTPISMGTMTPSRANISYSMNSDDGDGNDNEMMMINGQSSNWINTNDDALMINDEDNQYSNRNNKNGDNMHNNKIIIVSSSMYKRAISSNFIHWILFILFCITSVIYPLSQYEQFNGDFNVIPFGLGRYIQKFVQLINTFIIQKIKKQINTMNKPKGKDSKSN